MILDVGAKGGFTPRKLSGTGSVKERERDFAEPGSAGPPPPPRAPAAGAEFWVTGWLGRAGRGRPEPVRECALKVGRLLRRKSASGGPPQFPLRSYHRRWVTLYIFNMFY